MKNLNLQNQETSLIAIKVNKKSTAGHEMKTEHQRHTDMYLLLCSSQGRLTVCGNTLKSHCTPTLFPSHVSHNPQRRKPLVNVAVAHTCNSSYLGG
jgi:hypothetical protein